MTREELLRRRCQLIAEESHQVPQWWYLSFARDGFLGACIVFANGFATAIQSCNDQRINPGGQVLGHPVPAHVTLPPAALNRLLSKEDIVRLLGPILIEI
jgi:hypothetical protein